MVRNFGFVGLKDEKKASERAKVEFGKIFRETDYLRGGEPYYAHILRLISPKKGSRLLDLGIGRGFFLKEASSLKLNLRLFGVDFCDDAFKAAKKEVPKASLRVADIQELPFKDESFDVVTCLGVIEHLVNPARGVRESAKVLKTGGVAVFTIPNVWHIQYRFCLMYPKFFVARVLNVLKLRKKKAMLVFQPIDRFYTAQEGKRLLEKNGLRVKYAEALVSRREDFAVHKKFRNGVIPSWFYGWKSNFTLYVCEKK